MIRPAPGACQAAARRDEQAAREADMDKWTLVTGASSGIGADFARIAARERRNVAISARRKDRLEALAEELRSLGAPQVEIVQADLAEPGAADALWAAATAKGQVEILVNNAGLGTHDPFATDNWAREETMLEVNVMAMTRLMKLAVQHMLEAGAGRIINVASVAGFMPGPGMAAYHASKAYVVSLSEAVAEELRGTNVTVTALCPGATESEFFDSADMRDVRLVKRTKLPTAMSVAQAGWAGAKGGRRIIVPGGMNWVFTQAPRFVPKAWLMRVSRSVMAKEA